MVRCTRAEWLLWCISMYQKKKWGQEIKLFPNQPKRDFVYVKDVVSANIFAMQFYEQFRGMHHDVGTCESRTFEDICKCLETEYTYTDVDAVPKGYQMFTQADKRRTLMGWAAEYNLEDGHKGLSTPFADVRPAHLTNFAPIVLLIHNITMQYAFVYSTL